MESQRRESSMQCYEDTDLKNATLTREKQLDKMSAPASKDPTPHATSRENLAATGKCTPMADSPGGYEQ